MIAEKHNIDTEVALKILSNGDSPFIKLKGLSRENNMTSEERYNEAKVPTGIHWIYQNLDKAKLWEKEGGWNGFLMPEGKLLTDIDNEILGERLFYGLLNLGIKFIALKTPHGFQFIFADSKKVKAQVADFITAGGFRCDFRIANKGYFIWPSENTEGRFFLHVDSDIFPMQNIFLPIRKYRPEDEQMLLPIPIFEGSRDDTLFRHVCRLREWNRKYHLNLSENDCLQILETINSIFCEPPLTDQQIWQKIKSACRYSTDSHQEEWPDIIQFDNYSNLPDFPYEVLPEIGKEMVKVVAEVNQVDYGLPASIYFAMLSACGAKKFEVDLKTHKEPVNLFMCPVLDSGNRKTTTMTNMTYPLYEYQKQIAEEMKDEIREATNQYEISKARLIKLQKLAAQIDDSTERIRLQKDAGEVLRQIEENPVPKAPILIADDITSEATGLIMADNNERLAVISAEGGIFGIMAGRYNEKGGNFDIYLKGHAGDPSVCTESEGSQNICLHLP